MFNNITMRLIIMHTKSNDHEFMTKQKRAFKSNFLKYYKIT